MRNKDEIIDGMTHPSLLQSAIANQKTSISLKTILDKQDEVVSIDVDVFDSAQAQLVSFLFLPFYDNIYNIFTFGFGNFFWKTFETFIISPIPE